MKGHVCIENMQELLDKHKDLLDSEHIKGGFLLFDQIDFNTGSMEITFRHNSKPVYLIPIDTAFRLGDSVSLRITEGKMKVKVSV